MKGLFNKTKKELVHYVENMEKDVTTLKERTAEAEELAEKSVKAKDLCTLNVVTLKDDYKKLNTSNQALNKASTKWKDKFITASNNNAGLVDTIAALEKRIDTNNKAIDRKSMVIKRLDEDLVKSDSNLHLARNTARSSDQVIASLRLEKSSCKDELNATLDLRTALEKRIEFYNALPWYKQMFATEI